MFFYPSSLWQGPLKIFSPRDLPGEMNVFYPSFLSQGTSAESSLLGPWQRRETFSSPYREEESEIAQNRTEVCVAGISSFLHGGR